MSIPHYIESTLIGSFDSIAHGFFTRKGGVSSAEFESLNCSLSSEDTPKSVLENRHRVASSLNCEKLISLKQIHSNKVIEVKIKSDINQVIEGDGMVTTERKTGLGVLGADCAAVLFVDTENQVIGSAHGGWQGALTGITDNVIEAMIKLGGIRENLVAAIGPGIQKNAYEVGEEFMERFLRQSPIPCENCFSLGENGQGIYFDLPAYLESRLINCGVKTIDRLNEDTYSNPQQFFSYRRSCHQGDKYYGRQISVIALK